MGAEDIFNYVMETPGNTNPNVLRSLLDNFNSKVLVVHNIDSSLDKTWQEIYDGALIGVVILVVESSEQISIQYLNKVTQSEQEYKVEFGETYFTTSSKDGYPMILD